MSEKTGDNNESNPFEGYGRQKSIHEAVEELCVSCIAAGMGIPKALVFTKKDLDIYYKQMLGKPKIELSEAPKTFYWEIQGNIEFREEGE